MQLTKHYGTMRYNTIRYDTIRYDTIRYNTIKYNTIQCNTIQYNTIQYNTIQYNYYGNCLKHFLKTHYVPKQIYIESTYRVVEFNIINHKFKHVIRFKSY